MTGKAENTYVENNLLMTLQKYRELFSNPNNGGNFRMEQQQIEKSSEQAAFDNFMENDDTFGAIVEEIENENYIKRFTTDEQMELGLSIVRNLQIAPRVNKEVLKKVKSFQELNGILEKQKNDVSMKNDHETIFKRN